MASTLRRQVRTVGVLALLAAPPYLLATGGTVPISQLAICQSCPQPSPKRWDFNGDGYRDLVVGVPYESVGGQISAGAVQVLYGGMNGISAAENQFFSHLTWPKTGDGLAGSGLGSGDFNGDGYADLAVGAPDHSPSPSGLPKTGIVDVMYGSSAGLIGWKHQVWDSLSDPDWPDSKDFDSFGAALAAADFNDDGYDDLAIGVPGGTGGYVIVLDGSATGLTSSGSDVWTQDTAGIPGVAEDFDQFGAVLIAGNFGNGPADDLAIGAPGDFVATRSLGGGGEGGSVHILYGSGAGLTVSGTQRFAQGGALGNSPEEGDNFGASLASADFNADGSADLAIAAPDETLAGGSGGSDGIVYVIYGSSGGLKLSTAQVLSATTLGVSKATRTLGYSLAAGNFGAQGCVGCDDLAVGAPLEPGPQNENHKGAVYLMYGSTSGLGTYQKFAPGGAIPGKTLFGWSLAAHNFGKGAHDDLAIGVSQNTSGGYYGAGAVVALYGGTIGLSTIGVQLWSQGSPGVQGTPEADDGFGYSLGK